MKTTKGLFTLLSLICFLGFGSCSSTQVLTNDPDRSSVRRINRSINQETKRLRSAGYAPEVGAPAMQFQLRRAFEKEFELDDHGRNRYMIGVGSAISGIENAARMHAISDAAINASIMLESRIMGLIENDYNNKLYSRDEFQTLSRMVGVFSNILAQTLPTGVPSSAFVKDNGKHYEYQVRVAYPMDVMRERSATVISDILGRENDELRKKMERVTGMDRIGQ